VEEELLQMLLEAVKQLTKYPSSRNLLKQEQVLVGAIERILAQLR
jgi:hypothetical protein